MDIKTDLLVRVALKHGLVSEETIAEVMREQAENKAKGLPVQKLGDALMAKGLIDLEQAKKFLRDKADAADTGAQVQYEELDASLQAGEQDCLADFESFDDLGADEFAHEAAPRPAPAAPSAPKAPAAPAPTAYAAEPYFEPEAETALEEELEEEEEELIEELEEEETPAPPAPAPKPAQPEPQPEKTLIMPRAPKQEAAGEPEKTLIMPRSPKPEAAKPGATGEPEKTLIMPRPPKPESAKPAAASGEPEKTLVMPRSPKQDAARQAMARQVGATDPDKAHAAPPPARPSPSPASERRVALPTVTASVPPVATAPNSAAAAAPAAAPASAAGAGDAAQTIAVAASELKPGAIECPSPVNSDPMVGKMFGEYRIIQRLGADVAGVTYRAVFLRECRVVTLRILKMTSMANNPAAVEKFIATVRRAYKLEHPKIQRILTAGQNGKQLYYAAEYFTGNSLRRELMQKHTLSAQDTINIALSVADALAYAHSVGMYHTQIDPSKIIIGTDGNVKLLGFGLGIEAADNLDWLAESLGDMPYYVAPEMATSGEARKFIGAVTDLYSLGAVMFHCLTGTPPFHGETLDEILLDMYQEESLHERLYASDTVPPELAELVLQLLNPEPQKRIGSAQDLIKLLRKVSNELLAQQNLGANAAAAFGVDMSGTGAFAGVNATSRQSAVTATLRNPPVGEMTGSVAAFAHHGSGSRRGFSPGVGGAGGVRAPGPATSARGISARRGGAGGGNNESRRGAAAGGGNESRRANSKKAAEADMNKKVMIFGGIAIVLLIIVMAVVSTHQADERLKQEERNRIAKEKEKLERERLEKEAEEKEAAKKLEKEKAAEEKKKAKEKEKAAKKAASRQKAAAAAAEAAAAKETAAEKPEPAAEETEVQEVPAEEPVDKEEESDAAQQKKLRKRGLFGGLQGEGGGDD